jgi:hypothetical protein
MEFYPYKKNVWGRTYLCYGRAFKRTEFESKQNYPSSIF